MCDAKGGGNKSKSGGGGGGGLNDKIKDIFTPNTTSIAKNKAAGAAHTASQQAKGIGVARSNITGSSGKAIKGVANSQTNPALVNLAINGVKGKDGLAALSKAQAASLGKDTSFTGIFNDIVNDTKHKPVESLLQFGTRTMQEKDASIRDMLDGGPSVNGGSSGSYTNYKGSAPTGDPRGENNVHKDYSTSPKLNAVPSGFDGVGGGVVPPVPPVKPVPPVVPPVVLDPNPEGASTPRVKAAIPQTNLSAAGAIANPDGLKNILAVKKGKQQRGKRNLRIAKTGQRVAGAGVGLNIA